MHKVRLARIQAGLSQDELAEKANVSQHTISEVELGRRRPQGKTLRKLAAALDVSIPDLIGEVEQDPKVLAPLSLSEASAASARFSELPGLMAARERRGIIRNELAARSGISPSDLAGLEEGTREATPDTLERLTAVLGCSPLELGAPPEQYGDFLTEIEREHELRRRELEQLSPSDQRALAMRLLLESPPATKAGSEFAKAINDSIERQARARPEAG